jgi:hypothetical protein
MWVSVCLGLLLLVYIGSFATWWMSSPAQVRVDAGRSVRHIELHMTPFRWRTLYLWLPGIWYMEHIIGYRLINERAAGSDSIYVYEKS